ncbi:MAG: hypothetical protein M0Z69_03530 [Actinomycetota bacterium]|nr:hypothetical protein [Actinomycetota bacterium]
MINGTDSPHVSALRRHRLTVFALIVALVVGLVAVRLVLSHRGPSASGAVATTAAVGRVAPVGPFTTTSDHTTNLASYVGGHPTMVWFVVAGCASCAVSIPAVARHLHQLASDHVHVVVLDLYGDLGSGKAATTDLAEFGGAAAGAHYASPTWTWGLASKALSYAYDPSGTPDEYFLIAPNGHIVYQNSVPVSTMPQLLTAAGASG